MYKNDVNISTPELQKRYYHFCSEKAPLISNHNNDYIPKAFHNQIHNSKDLIKDKF